MTTSTARWLARGLLALTVAALTVSAALGVVIGDLMDAFAFTPVLLAFAVVGAIVAGRRPGNPISWLFLAEALGFALGVAASAYAKYAVRAGVTPPWAAWAAWLGAIPAELGFLFALALLLFPDGRLPSSRWRVLAWLIAGAEALLLLAAATSSAALRAQGSAVLISPVRLIPDSVADPVVNVVQTAFIPLCLAAAAGCAVRYRRSAADERHQIKWVAYAGLLTAVSLVVGGIVFNNPLPAFLVAGPLIPVAVGFAILKYRLYDIDVILNKTIVYGLLAAFITLVYVVIVAGIGSLGSGFLQAGSRPGLGLSILATAVVAVAFQPVRERVQHLANRLVFGKRATPYEALSEFAGRMGGTYAVDDVLPRMARVLAEATGASRAVVWVKTGAELTVGASWPPGTRQLPQPVALTSGEPPEIGGADRITLVDYQEETLGALSVAKRPGETLTPVEDKLMSDLAAQAGLVLRNIGLAGQLRARLAELQASRLRIVAAADDQRRRIERDIHDGAQQELLSIAATLALAESVVGHDEERERALVARLKAETSGALATLRELARGIYPPLLADQGLAAAVTTHAGKAPVPVEVCADGLGRYPAEIETAVYFCCVEALQNATRHAPGAAVRISLADSGTEVGFTVTDHGPGFDPAAITAGAGLQNMNDRMTALGGFCQTESCPGQGTTVTGRIRCAALPAGTPVPPADGPHGVEIWS